MIPRTQILTLMAKYETELANTVNAYNDLNDDDPERLTLQGGIQTMHVVLKDLTSMYTESLHNPE